MRKISSAEIARALGVAEGDPAVVELQDALCEQRRLVAPPQRGVYRGPGSWYVANESDEILMLLPMAQVASALAGYLAGLGLWPYALVQGVIQLVFTWLKVRPKASEINWYQAVILKALIADPSGLSAADLQSRIAEVARVDEGLTSIESIEATLKELLALRRANGEPVAVVRQDGGRWYPVNL